MYYVTGRSGVTGRGGTGGGLFGPGGVLTAVRALLALLPRLLLLLVPLLFVSSPSTVLGPFLGPVPGPPRAIMLSRCSTLARSSAFSRLRASICLDLASMCTTILFFTCRTGGPVGENGVGLG